MDEGRAIVLRVVLIGLLVIPCWFLQRELVPPPGTGWYLNLFFFFFGPIFAGFYAGASARSAVMTLYTVVIASVVLTLIYTVLWLTDLFYFELIPIMVQLFSLIFGLLLAGAIPVLFAHRLFGRR
jgi:hypothetical protein